MQNILLSVLLPTRNGMPWVKYAIESLRQTTLDASQLQVVISDNSDYPLELENDIQRDSRFKIVRTSGHLSLAANWENALKHSDGEWIVFLGSDDAVAPRNLSHLVEAVLPNLALDWLITTPAYFTWPGTHVIDEQMGTGRLEFFVQREELKSNNVQKIVRKSKYSARGMLRLPIPYARAFVRRSLLSHILQRQAGTLSRSAIPDWYLGKAISSLQPQGLLFQGLPVFVAGASNSSLGLSTVTRAEWQATRWREVWDRDARGIEDQTGIKNDSKSAHLLAFHMHESTRHLRSREKSSSWFSLAIHEILWDPELDEEDRSKLRSRTHGLAPSILRCLEVVRPLTLRSSKFYLRWQSMASLGRKVVCEQATQFRLIAFKESTIQDAWQLLDELSISARSATSQHDLINQVRQLIEQSSKLKLHAGRSSGFLFLPRRLVAKT